VTPVRRGGWATIAGGDVLTWTEAEGARGTRWREAVERDGQLTRALLLEAAPDGRLTRLEMTTGVGLLTLHPEPDQSAMHGNVVGGDRVRHLALPWSPEHELFVLGSPAAATITFRRLASMVVVGASRLVDVLAIDDELQPARGRWSIERVAQHAWDLRDIDGPEERCVTVRDDGRPVLPDEVTWPLEV
jgi:hypothetical protein